MTAPEQKKMTPEERRDHLETMTETALDILAADLSQGHSDNFLKLLEFHSRFHRYSARNTLLILLQRPMAYRVASYRRWEELGRKVAHGSKALYIYAPLTKRERDAITGEMQEKIFGWKLVPVFSDTDLENIDTDPLPSLWSPLPDDCQPLVENVIAGLTARGVTVTTQRTKGGIQGFATIEKIVLSDRLPDSRNRLATLLHEAAHQMAHFGPTAKDKPTQQCELEAEAAAWVMLHQHGIAYPFSADYLLSHQITPEDLHLSLVAVTGIVRRLHTLLETPAIDKAA